MTDIAPQPAPSPPHPGWVLIEDTGFLGHIGPIWRLDRDSAPALLGFDAADHHRNTNGVVQGGMLMTLADRGMGMAAHGASRTPVATISFTFDFLAAAEIGRFVELHPEVIRMTGGMVFMEGRLFDGDALIGRASGVWKRLKPRR
ncbi:PaaI family thioesterase [Pseudooceanicola aestuarii]|uniref:PaaI family thioesterase n=1 Tax=Pseudooceanicola aestuarii TaxID=2697319 RepID=UPI0013D8240E|nr:PaaI family thioesterase [Pseudooceanicola aestuarii]